MTVAVYTLDMTRRRTADARLAIAYLRVSTDDQQLGPVAQRASIEAWAAAAGVTVIAWHSDIGVSGAAPFEARPALQSAVADLVTHGAGVLVVAKRDRLARDTMTAAVVTRMVERAGATVTSADGAGNGTGPEAALMRGIIDAFAQYERAMISTRTKAALAVKRNRGEKLGGSCPIGTATTDGVQLVSDAGEAAAVARILELRAAGVSLVKIAARLDAEGHRARGARWYPTTVVNILKRAA
jgi:DNA invertase Pin-like site-specific DNA recombinase